MLSNDGNDEVGSFIDNSFEVDENPFDCHRFNNVTRSEDNAVEDAFSESELQEDIGISNYCKY